METLEQCALRSTGSPMIFPVRNYQTLPMSSQRYCQNSQDSSNEEMVMFFGHHKQCTNLHVREYHYHESIEQSARSATQCFVLFCFFVFILSLSSSYLPSPRFSYPPFLNTRHCLPTHPISSTSIPPKFQLRLYKSNAGKISFQTL